MDFCSVISDVCALEHRRAIIILVIVRMYNKIKFMHLIQYNMCMYCELYRNFEEHVINNCIREPLYLFCLKAH